MHCPITGVNIPRFILTFVGGFAFVFGFDYIVHHKWLMDLYEQTKDLWRPEETMGQYFPLMFVRTALLVAISAYIYTRHHEGKGIAEGLRFGVPLGLLFAVIMGSSYIWLPIPLALGLGWVAAGFGTGLGLGIIFSLVYKK